jgi:hypothetical protein
MGEPSDDSDFAINKIRSALADNAETPRYFGTLPKRGCRFVCPVEQSGGIESRPIRAPDRRTRRYIWASAVVAGLSILVVLVWISSSDGVSPTRIRRMAVLPFENLSHNSAEDYLADGITDSLITDLGRNRTSDSPADRGRSRPSTVDRELRKKYR